jgi:hypothetical protein
MLLPQNELLPPKTDVSSNSRVLVEQEMVNQDKESRLEKLGFGDGGDDGGGDGDPRDGKPSSELGFGEGGDDGEGEWFSLFALRKKYLYIWRQFSCPSS